MNDCFCWGGTDVGAVQLKLVSTGIGCDDILDPQLDQGFSGGFRVLRLLTFS